MQKLKIAFAGTPKFAIPSLRNLIQDEGIEISAVYTQPDKAAGRGKILTPPPVKIFALENDLKVSQPSKLTKADLEGLDFFVVVAYGKILPKEILEIPKFGCVNLHASLLPKFRGASPIQSAILADEQKTGVTFMQIGEQLDAGAAFAKFEISIAQKNALELSAELAELGGKELPEILRKITSEEISPVKQNESKATFCRKIQKSDGEISWEKDSTKTLLLKLQAFAGWPNLWTKFGGKTLKLISFVAWQPSAENLKNGEVFEQDGKIGVKTSDGAIELKKIQLEGKNEMSVGDFVRGNRDFVGAKLG